MWYKLKRIMMRPNGVEKQVRPKRLPSAYQEVEYIESSWTQRIETGVTVNSENRIFKIKYWPLSSWDTLFGTLQFSNTEAAIHTRYSRLSNLIVWDCYKWNWYGRVSYSSSQSWIEEMELWNNYIKDIPTWTTLTTGTVWNYSTSDVIPIFCYKVTDRTNQFSYAWFKLYYFQIIDNWTMIRDFVPCYRKLDTEIWLYDLVNDVFYTNSWTWTFTKWPDVN